MRQLINEVLMLPISGATIAGQTAITTSTFDTQGYDVVFVKALVGTVAASGTVTLKLQGGEAANGSDKADIAGATWTAPAAVAGGYVHVEIHRPTSRYITAVITRAVANSDILNVEALLTGATHTPVTQTAALNGVSLVSPLLA